MDNKEIIIALLSDSIKTSRLVFIMEKIGIHADFFFTGHADTCLALMGIPEEKADKLAEYIYEYEREISEIPFEELKEGLNEIAERLYEKIKTFYKCN